MCVTINNTNKPPRHDKIQEKKSFRIFNAPRVYKGTSWKPLGRFPDVYKNALKACPDKILKSTWSFAFLFCLDHPIRPTTVFN